jgi:hypothetical protein
MTIEELLRSSQVQTADNGVVYAAVDGEWESNDSDSGEVLSSRAAHENLARMVATVPRSLVPRLDRAATYFVPWLYKQRRSVAIDTHPAPAGETRKELCHHVDVKPQGKLLLISLGFYAHDSYGLAMEFFDKVAYLATLEAESRDDFPQLLRQQLAADAKMGELTPDAWEWRQALAKAKPGASENEAWENYRRAVETDTLGLYMASLFTDIFYEDLFEPDAEYPLLAPDAVYERVRMAERLYPANRGYSLQIVRQKPKRGRK